MYEIGAAKVEMTPFIENCGMMGYGQMGNVCKEVATPIHARAFVIKDGKKKIVFLNAEICFPTLTMKEIVLEELRREGHDFQKENVMITAQHTHSAPGGYSHYFFYNIPVPGFKKEVFETYVRGMAEAILQAEENCQPAKIFFSRGTFSDDTDIAFNRSLKPYNANPEINPKLKSSEAHLAVDREMKLLRFEQLDGTPIGCLNWFGVHATSISNDNTKIHFDNKGFAAQFLEEYLAEKAGEKAPITIFAQEAAGDVTPNYIWDKKKKWTRGKYEDDIKSAEYNGRLQYNMAQKLYDDLDKNAIEIKGELDFAANYVDFACVKVDPEFAGGKTHMRTSQPCLGVSFLEGTVEGPGMPRFVGHLARVGNIFVKAYRLNIFKHFMPYRERVAMVHMYKTQWPKTVVLEMGEGRILGTKRVRNLIIPGFADPVIRYFKDLDRRGITRTTPWEPHVLQLQIQVLGNLAIIGIPAEITTVAGRRLRATLLEILKERGVTEIILSPYANGYSGYITTYEEYQLQKYEGGHTVFGKWTLAAHQTKFRELAKELLLPKDKRERLEEEDPALPHRVKEEEIWYGF